MKIEETIGKRLASGLVYMVCLVFGCLLLSYSPAAAAAPPQLYGKSIVVSWSETRSEREIGEQGEFHPVVVSRQMSTYISTVGRPFNRIVNSRGSKSGGNEQVGASGHFTLQFQGHSLLQTHVSAGGDGATRVQSDFDDRFESCRAHVTVAKAAGSSTFTHKSSISGKMFETQSVAVGAATCSVKNGNIFGE